MSNIATTIEQSKHLLELGLSPDSADMEYCYIDEFNSGLQVKSDINVEVDKKLDVMFGVTHIPAWSLSALLEVMPNEYQPLLRKECKWYMDAWYEYGNLIAGGCYKPLDAAYEMVCKMLERGLLEKGGE